MWAILGVLAKCVGVIAGIFLGLWAFLTWINPETETPKEPEWWGPRGL